MKWLKNYLIDQVSIVHECVVFFLRENFIESSGQEENFSEALRHIESGLVIKTTVTVHKNIFHRE